jgi:hypothetical protein
MKHLPELLISKQTAEFLNRHPRTLNYWRDRNFGPPFVRVGWRILYKLSDLENFLEANRFVPEPHTRPPRSPAAETGAEAVVG